MNRALRVTLLAVVTSTLAACSGGPVVEGSIGVTVTRSGGLAYVLVWCDDPPTSLSIDETSVTDPGMRAAYEAKDLPHGFTTLTVDAAAPAPWTLTEGTADLPAGLTYRAFMGNPGQQSSLVAAVFNPDEVHRRVRPGEVYYLPYTNEPALVAPLADFQAHVRKVC